MGSCHRPRSPRGRRVQAPRPPSSARPTVWSRSQRRLRAGWAARSSSSSPNHFADTHDQDFRQKSKDASVYAVGWWRRTSRRLLSATDSCAMPCARCVIRVESPAWDGRRERQPRFSIHQVDVPGPTIAARTPSNQLERQRGAWLNESFRCPAPGVPRPLRRPRRRPAVGPMTPVAGGGESQLGGLPPASWWPCLGTG